MRERTKGAWSGSGGFSGAGGVSGVRLQLHKGLGVHDSASDCSGALG